MSNVISFNFKPRKWQQFCINKLTRFNIYVIHRRGGKTKLCTGIIANEVLQCKHHNPQGIYIALTYASAKKIAWSMFKDLLEKYPNVRFYENELRIVLPRENDVATIYLAGAENIDNLRGLYTDILVLDEKAFMGSNIDEVIIPFITDRKGKVIQISSVKGRNQFYKDYIRYKQYMEAGDKDFFAINLTVEDTGLLDREEIELVKKNMSEEAFRQEFMNDFSAGDAATFYGKEMERMHMEKRITSVPYDPMYPLDVYFDLGMNDMTSMWFRQTVGREFRYVNYYQNSGEAIPHYVNHMRSLYPQANWGRIVLPWDAEIRELSSGKTRQETFREMGVRTEVQKKQSLQDRINAVRTHLPKVVIDAVNCSEGIECLQNYSKKKDERNDVFTNTPIHNKYSHGADAFGYAALDERPSVDDMRRKIESLPKVVNDRYDIYGGGKY